MQEELGLSTSINQGVLPALYILSKLNLLWTHFIDKKSKVLRGQIVKIQAKSGKTNTNRILTKCCLYWKLCIQYFI